MEATQEATQEDTTMSATQKAQEERKRTIAVFKEDDMKLIEFLRDSELLYNKRLMDNKDPNKRETLWDKFCIENMDKVACKKWIQSLRTMYGKITHMKLGQCVPHYTNRQKWLKKNFGFLNTDIVHHHFSKSAFKPAREATVSRPPNGGHWSLFQLAADVDRLKNHNNYLMFIYWKILGINKSIKYFKHSTYFTKKNNKC